MAENENDSASSIDPSEFARALREFTDLIREIHASDLSTGDRVKLHSLMEALADLRARLADPVDPSTGSS